MKDVGNAFREDTVDIPRVLSAARGVRLSLEVLEPYLKSAGRDHAGTAIIGTVEGDLHEVGKNLVAIMFRSGGFEVIDLGVDVTDKQFVKAVKEHPEVQLVCISSLLTTSLPQMRRAVKLLRGIKRSRKLYIMVGGGSVTEEMALDMGADAYTDNAVDAALVARKLLGIDDTDIEMR